MDDRAPFFVWIPGEVITSIHSRLENALTQAANDAIIASQGLCCNPGEDNVRLVEDVNGTTIKVEASATVVSESSSPKNRRMGCDAAIARVKSGSSRSLYLGAEIHLDALLAKFNHIDSEPK